MKDNGWYQLIFNKELFFISLYNWQVALSNPFDIVNQPKNLGTKPSNFRIGFDS